MERLKKCLETAAAFFKTVVTEGEGRIWKDLLNLCSIGEIEKAFHDWHLKPWGDQYPRMPQPGDILEMVGQERAKAKYDKVLPGCNQCVEGWVGLRDAKGRRCVKPCDCVEQPGLRALRERHEPDTGYNWVNDIKAIFVKRFSDSERGHPWTIQQWYEAYDEIDAKRPDGPPAWRKTEEGRNFLREYA